MLFNTTEQELLFRLNTLSQEQRQTLINGISFEAAEIIKYLIPNSPLIDQLLQVKQN